MSILKNSIDSIQVGIEDYEEADARRNISAVRNISAGILLLYKEKLCRLSPDYDKELLIKQDIRPVVADGKEIKFKGFGKKTVDVQAIKERFKSLGVEVDWSRFDEINLLRNEMEHYFTSRSPETVRELIAKSFVLIRDFLVNELDENPQDLIGNACWSVLLNVNEIYEAEVTLCSESLSKIDWKYNSVEESLQYLRCPDPNCQSSLIHAPFADDTYPTVNLHCKSCGKEFCFDDVVEGCIEESLYGEVYLSFKDCGDEILGMCNECDKNTFIYAEGTCVACGYSLEHLECERCGVTLGLQDQHHGGVCDYCQYQWEKLMAE